MPYRRTSVVAVLFFAALLVPHSPARAQAARPADTTFHVGLKTIAIPSPADDLVETGPDYRVMLENLVPNNNRLVAGYLTQPEFDKLRTATTTLSRYAMVQVPRTAEFVDITPEIFKQINDTLATQFEAQADASVKDSQDEINRRLKAVGQGSTTITLDKPLMLGLFFSKPYATGYGEITPVAVNGGASQKVAAGITFIRVQQRVLFLYIYAPYKDEDTVKWVRTTGEKWADAILAANK
jgi:hypothetical protein